MHYATICLCTRLHSLGASVAYHLHTTCIIVAITLLLPLHCCCHCIVVAIALLSPLHCCCPCIVVAIALLLPLHCCCHCIIVHIMHRELTSLLLLLLSYCYYCYRWLESSSINLCGGLRALIGLPYPAFC